MKAFVAALVLLAALTGGAFGASYLLADAAETLATEAEALPNADAAHRKEACRAMIDDWEAKEFSFTMVLHYTELDALKSILARLEMTAETENKDDYLAAAAELGARLRHLQELCRISLSNIL